MKAPMMVAAALLLSFLACLPSPCADAASAQATGVDRAEAAELVLLVPEIHDALGEGLDVRIGSSGLAGFNEDAYFGFKAWVPNEVSSGIIGTYAVNKRTADLWDWARGAWVCSANITRRQQELRMKHHITEEDIARYRDVPINAGETSAGNMVCRESRPEVTGRHP